MSDLRQIVLDLSEMLEFCACLFEGDSLGDCGNWPNCPSECPLRKLRELAGIIPQDDEGVDKQPAVKAAGEQP